MKKKNKSGLKAFSLTEMLIVAAIALVVIASIPIFIMRRGSLNMNSSHGEIECYFRDETGGNAVCVNHGDNTVIDSTDGNFNNIPVPRNVKKFIVQVVPATGGGSTAYLNELELVANTEGTTRRFNFNIFNPGQLQSFDDINERGHINENVGTAYSVIYPNENRLRDLMGEAYSEIEGAADDIINETINQLNGQQIEVTMRAPNGVKPVMQYYRPNISYPHFRGLGLFGNITEGSDYIRKTSNMPWPNLLRYSEIALGGTQTKKIHLFAPNETITDGTAFPTFKEMFVRCSHEYEDGRQHRQDADGIESCFKQCEDSFYSFSADSLKYQKQKNGPIYAQAQKELIAPRIAAIENILENDTSVFDANNYTATFYYKTPFETFENLPYPVYGRTILQVYKPDANTDDDKFLNVMYWREKILSGFVGFLGKIRNVNKTVCDAAVKAIDFLDVLDIMDNAKDGLEAICDRTDEFISLIEEMARQSKLRHRFTTYRTEPANIKMLKSGTGDIDGYSGNIYFTNPRNGCHFVYQYAEVTNASTGAERHKTKKVQVLNPEVFVEDDGSSYARNIKTNNPNQPLRFRRIKNDKSIGNTYYIPQVSNDTDDGTPGGEGSKIYERNFFYPQGYPKGDYICGIVKSRQVVGKNHGMFDITNGRFMPGTKIFKDAPMFLARCYVPVFYDKGSLYNREMTAPEASGNGGSGAAISVRRNLADGLRISFNVQGEELDNEGNLQTVNRQNWADAMIPNITLRNPYNLKGMTDEEKTSISSHNSNITPERARIWGIKSGMCDGTFDHTNVFLGKTPGVMAGDGITRGTLMLRSYTVCPLENGCRVTKHDDIPSVRNNSTIRGESISVRFYDGNDSEAPEATYTVNAGRAGGNVQGIGEIHQNLIGMNYANIWFDDYYQNFVQGKSEDLKNLGSALFGSGTPASGENGSWTQSVSRNADQYTVDAEHVSQVENGVDTYAGYIPGSTSFNDGLGGTDSVNKEIDILRNQGGGSARLVCDYEGNARSNYFTGKEARPNIEIIPGRIWLELTIIGNRVAAIRGDESGTDEKTGIVKVSRGENAKNFAVTLGRGGTPDNNPNCPNENRKAIRLGNFGPEVGYACKGNKGEDTTVIYGGEGVRFGIVSSDEDKGKVEGTEGGEGGEAISAADVEDIEAFCANTNFGQGNCRTFNQRVTARLHMGVRDVCIYDNQNRNCDLANEGDIFGQNNAQNGRGAVVRIIW